MSSIATKRIAKNTVMLYIRMFLIMVMTLYTSRIVLAALGVVDYGIYNVVSGFVVMLSFLNGAMAQSTQRFMAYEIGQGNKERLKTTFKTAFTIHLIIALIIIILAETIGLWFLNYVMNIPADQMYAANWVYQCSILSFTISIIQVPYNACIIAHEKMQAYAYIGIIEVIMKFSVAFLISSVVSSERLIVYAVMLSGVSLLTCGFYVTYCWRNFTECISRWYHERKLFNTMFGYAAWSTLGTFAWVCKSQGCNLILNIFFGPVINAAYGISAQVNTAVSNFVLNFTTAVNPQIVKSYSQDDFGNLQKLVTYGSKFSFFLMLLLSFPILLNTDRLLHIWLTEVPDYAIIFTQLIIINSLVETFSYCMGAGIQATGKIKYYQIIVGITVLLNLPLSYLFLRLGYSPTVIYVITIILSFIAIAERLGLLKHTVPTFSISTFTRKVLVPAFFVSLAAGIIYYMCVNSRLINDTNIIISLLLSFLTITSIILIIGLNTSERRLIFNYLRNKILHK